MKRHWSPPVYRIRSILPVLWNPQREGVFVLPEVWEPLLPTV